MEIPSLLDLEHQALQAAQCIFPCEKELMDKIPLDEIVSTFQKDLTPTEKPFLIRVAGQSGSGKSSQLAPALQKALKNKPFIKINVGAFASFHPNFDKWQKNAHDKMRENTNGFALRALILFYKYCLTNHINTLLDMTLLEPEIDLYLMRLAKENGYKIQMHVSCVPKKVSDHFIRERQIQTGRFVKPSSSLYFFTALAPCLKALTHSGLFDQKDTLILWSHFNTAPIKKTHLNNTSVLRLLNAYQCPKKHLKIKKPHHLLKLKIKWMCDFMQGWFDV